MEMNNNTNTKTTNFKEEEEDKVATTRLHKNPGQQTSPMWSATDVIGMATTGLNAELI